MPFDPEFIKALQQLPSKEKDKLILRLLNKDTKLASRLRFELVETDSVEDKRSDLSNEIIEKVKWATNRYYSPGILLMDMREISGLINEHVAITKDKIGEISLNLFMIRQLLELNNERIAVAPRGKSYTLCIYIIARVFKILLLIQKQHPDLHFDFKEDIEIVGRLIGRNDSLMKTAIHNGLDVNWLLEFEIPEDIVEIHKNIKAMGFLK